MEVSFYVGHLGKTRDKAKFEQRTEGSEGTRHEYQEEKHSGCNEQELRPWFGNECA